MVVNEYENRLSILGCLVILIIVILVARVGYLQVYDGEKYARLADGNRIRLIPTMAPRGTFYDRNGNNIVTNRPGFTVSLLPLTGPISPDVISRQSSLLNISEEEIKSKIESHVGFEPIRIKNDVGPEIRSKKIYIRESSLRFRLYVIISIRNVVLMFLDMSAKSAIRSLKARRSRAIRQEIL